MVLSIVKKPTPAYLVRKRPATLRTLAFVQLRTWCIASIALAAVGVAFSTCTAGFAASGPVSPASRTATTAPLVIDLSGTPPPNASATRRSAQTATMTIDLGSGASSGRSAVTSPLVINLSGSANIGGSTSVARTITVAALIIDLRANGGAASTDVVKRSATVDALVLNLAGTSAPAPGNRKLQDTTQPLVIDLNKH
jgi:hypothetical protein